MRDADREVRARRARGGVSRRRRSSEATFGEDDRTSRRSIVRRRERETRPSADGAPLEAYALPHAAVSEDDAQYLYSLNDELDSCAHHALALGRFAN